MEISQCLKPQCVVKLAGSTKAEVLEELITVLAGSDPSVDREEISAAVWKREEMMSTGIGHGVAIPHVRMAGVATAVMAVGISRRGIADYKSLDGKMVHIIVLIAAPAGEHDTYIRLLAQAADVFRHEDLRRAMIDAKDTAESYRILTGGGARAEDAE